ncbi:hypothetical protein B0H13DRAFT_1911687 [Mycena leptocephala]|nr:hypothetical protein B0H13DRAFT_1911687 [Mycena leptocephala]
MFELQLLTAIFIGASAIQGASISAPEAIVPLPIAGSMAMNSDNSISQVPIRGSLNVIKFESEDVLVPAAQAAKGTPIAAFSKSDLSEGGSTCTKCVDVFKFAVVSGSTALYVVSSGNATSTTATRVGFINAGSPTTLTQAIWNPCTNFLLAGMRLWTAWVQCNRASIIHLPPEQ